MSTVPEYLRRGSRIPGPPANYVPSKNSKRPKLPASLDSPKARTRSLPPSKLLRPNKYPPVSPTPTPRKSCSKQSVNSDVSTGSNSKKKITVSASKQRDSVSDKIFDHALCEAASDPEMKDDFEKSTADQLPLIPRTPKEAAEKGKVVGGLCAKEIDNRSECFLAFTTAALDSINEWLVFDVFDFFIRMV